MPISRCSNFAVTGALLVISGCASHSGAMLAALERESISIELVDTPFHAQVTDQCGPSALATILGSSGIIVAPDTLKSQVYIPGREGSLQIELIAATRSYQRIPYQIDPHIKALFGELQSGRPVLVMQNLGIRIAPKWHYAVAIGYQSATRQFILRSGPRKRLLMDADDFIRTWKRADYWGVVALQPGELPFAASADQYLRSVAALERAGDARSAEAGYLSATLRWPQEPLAWLGLGNAYYAQQKLHEAADAYRLLLQLESNHLVGLNNLGQVQAELGCQNDAQATLDIALAAAASDPAMRALIQSTRAEIAGATSADTCR